MKTLAQLFEENTSRMFGGVINEAYELGDMLKTRRTNEYKVYIHALWAVVYNKERVIYFSRIPDLSNTVLAQIWIIVNRLGLSKEPLYKEIQKEIKIRRIDVILTLKDKSFANNSFIDEFEKEFNKQSKRIFDDYISYVKSVNKFIMILLLNC